MKYIILLGDGMADHPLPEYGDRTPIEVAATPHLDRMASLGLLGQFCPIPDGLPPGSDIGNLSMFGYEPAKAFRGRAPIEAANQGITLADNEVAFRCNLVTLRDGRMEDFTAGHISSEEGAQVVAALNERYGGTYPIKFYPGVSYRHLAVVRAADSEELDRLCALDCTPPHNITGQEWRKWLADGPGAEMVAALMLDSQDWIAELPVNRHRVAQGMPAATSIWLWGQGKAPAMEPYASKFGITGAVISAVDLVKGLGVCAGLDVIDVPGATGWIDTNYEGKTVAGLEALGTHDFVYIHLEAPDETAHQGRADLKIKAIEDFDARVVGPCLEWALKEGNTRVLAAPDHFTLISTKTHAGGPVPFVLCGPGVGHNGHDKYSEAEAKATGVCVTAGHRLVQRMIQDTNIDEQIGR